MKIKGGMAYRPTKLAYVKSRFDIRPYARASELHVFRTSSADVGFRMLNVVIRFAVLATLAKPAAMI